MPNLLVDEAGQQITAAAKRNLYGVWLVNRAGGVCRPAALRAVMKGLHVALHAVTFGLHVAPQHLRPALHST